MKNVRFVLCRPSHPGNIGAAARAMKTMGFTDLRLVAPERFPAPEAQWMATHAVDVLADARVCGDLREAIGECVAAFALSARAREWSPQVLDVRSAAARAVHYGEDPVAFVFGNETAGLTNEEMFACQYLVHIPASGEFSSLNLAQAVQVVAYELFMTGAPEVRGRSEKLATVEDVEGLYAHLEAAAVSSGFMTAGSRLRERWRRLFSRVPMLEREEVNILRGLLKALLAK